MSIVFSSKKEKRSRSSSSEANNSFVKNVTSRVSGLLPATITKWFSSPSSSNTNGSAPTADCTDSSTEDEAPEVNTQPPTKRMRFNSPGSYNHYSDPNCITVNVDGEYSNTIQSPGRTTFRREPNYVSTPLRPPSEDTADARLDRTDRHDRPERLDRPDRHDRPDRLDRTDRIDRHESFFKQHTVTMSGPSVATKRKSLFDSPEKSSIRACAKTSSNTMRDPKQPCFKPSLLGSPFYPGMTMYGGASASYINHPNIKQRKNTLVNETSTSDNTISNSAKRVMDLLEHYSSPLNEAKRIPPYTRTSRNNSFNSTIESAPPTNKVISYKTQELYVPSIASILRVKQRSRLMDTTTAARQLIASHSSTADYLPYPSISSSGSDRQQPEEDKNSNKQTTKIKTKWTPRDQAKAKETIMPTPVSLPSATLQIDKDNLPKFSLAPTPTANLITSTPKPASLTAPSQSTDNNIIFKKITIPSKKETVNKPDSFLFARPVKVSNEPPLNLNTTTKFTFGSPDKSIDKPLGHKHKDDVSSLSGPKEQKETQIAKDWKCPDCWVSNKSADEKCVCCGCAKPSQSQASKPKLCSVCKLANTQSYVDKCINCDIIKVNNVSKEKNNKWRCGDCWVDNKESDEKCVCCGAAKPNAAKASTTLAAKPASNDTGEWKCEDCWIKNSKSTDKCVACGYARPGAKPATTGGFFDKPKSDNSFKTILKSQNDKWECSACLVRNDSDKSKCICCESEKPGSIPETGMKFNFGMNTSNTFKFGIDLKAQEASASKLDTPAATDKKPESETNNNSLSKTPTFSFGVPKKAEDQTDSAKKEEKAESTPKVAFTFGIPAAASTPAFSVTNPAETKPTEEDKESQVVPKVDFAVPTTKEAPKPVTNILTASTSQEKPFVPPQDKPSTSTAFLPPTFGTEKKEPQKEQSKSVAATTAEATVPTMQFSFGSGGGLQLRTADSVDPKPLLFGAPQTQTSNSTVFQKNEPTTTTSAMSLFTKSDTSSTVSLFQKSEPVSTIAPPALAATAPMFSFGGSSSSQTEKPKFNFTFGSNTANKTESTPFFNSSFGAPTENKFGLNAGTSNSLPSNLGGSLTSGSALSGNGIPGATLGGNGMANILGSDLSNTNSLQSNSLQAPTGGLFGNVQKDMSAPSTTANLFVTSAATSAQKPATFSFGSSTFSSNSTSAFGSSQTNATPAFGSAQTNTTTAFGTGQTSTTPAFGSTQTNTTPAFGSTQTNATPAFGSAQTNATPTFGSAPTNSTPAFGSAQTNTTTAFGTGLTNTTTFGSGQANTTTAFGGGQTQNVFGMGSQNSSGSLFSTQNAAPSVFGSPQAAAPSLFGTPSAGATPTFGAPNASIPTFEAPSMTPAPAPAFNFGASNATGVFGFGQQQQQQPPQQAGGVYNFGGTPTAGSPQVQFNMGSSNAAPVGMRRMRKAVRRNTPR